MDKEKPDTTLGYIFRAGNVIEDYAIKLMMDSGLKISTNPDAITWDKEQISGKIDCFINHDGMKIPVEIKSINGMEYPKINSVDDLLNSSKFWLRRYPAQLLSYMVMRNIDVGCFVFISKTTFEPKIIWVELTDEILQYFEKVLKAVELVNDTVNKYSVDHDDSILPPRVEYTESLCGKCDFRLICLPTRNSLGLQILEDDELVSGIARLSEIKSIAKEYDDLDEYIKERLKNNLGAGEYLCGNAVIKLKEQSRSSYNVPKELKGQYKESKLIKVVSYEFLPDTN
jgi:CRISPR/Cas system-associated exonuclease Cas4 (RecB family)